MVLSSSHRLSPAERELLEKGLTFIPTPKVLNKLQLRKDLYDYHRMLKILSFFDFNRSFTYLPFQNPSSWEPESTSQVPQTLMDRDLHAWRTPQIPPTGNGGRGPRQNITGDQRRTLALLIRSTDIIKPVDKGGQIVLQDRSDYLFKASRQHLSN